MKAKDFEKLNREIVEYKVNNELRNACCFEDEKLDKKQDILREKITKTLLPTLELMAKAGLITTSINHPVNEDEYVDTEISDVYINGVFVFESSLADISSYGLPAPQWVQSLLDIQEASEGEKDE